MDQSPGRLLVLGGAISLLEDFDLQLPMSRPLVAKQQIIARADHLLNAKDVRDYQGQAAVAALTAPLNRGIIDVGTGGGKTRICATIAALAGSAGYGRWLYVVQNKALATQSENAFLGLVKMMAKTLDFPASDVSIRATTYAGIKKLTARERDVDGVMVDECHLIPAPTRSLEYAKVRAHWRIGLSGTALDRQDAGNIVVIGLLGGVVFSAGVGELTKNGYLSQGSVQTVTYDHGVGRIVGGDNE